MSQSSLFFRPARHLTTRARIPAKKTNRAKLGATLAKRRIQDFGMFSIK
jgi:hypothetical protein